MPEETKTKPPWVAWREAYAWYLTHMPQAEIPGEAWTVAVAAKWRALGVLPADAAKWASMGRLPDSETARWVLDGITPELYLAMGTRVQAAWTEARNSLSSVERARALRFVGVRDTEDGAPVTD